MEGKVTNCEGGLQLYKMYRSTYVYLMIISPKWHGYKSVPQNQITTPMIKLSQIRTHFHLLAVITHQEHSENQASSTFPHALISFHHINPISSRNLSSLLPGTCVLSGTAQLEKQLVLILDKLQSGLVILCPWQKGKTRTCLELIQMLLSELVFGFQS